MNCLHIKKIMSFILCLIVITSSMMGATYAEKSPNLNLNCGSAVLIEADTGEVLYNKNKDKPMFPASTTKVMTALLALEKLDLKKEIKVPEDMGSADGSAMYLLPGEVFTVEELLQGLLIKSANDAAVLLAREISGSVEEFSILMNQRAKELGCKNANFKNPNGLPNREHTVSAYDLALIAREAMKIEKFRELVSTPFIQIHATEQTPEIRYFRNTNRFLWSSLTMNYKGKQVPIKYDVVDGIKTGYTEDAGTCLISSGEKNGIRVIAVALKSVGNEVYVESRKLLDYGFDSFRKKQIVKSREIIGSQDISKTVQKKLEYYVKENYAIVENINSKDIIDTNIVLEKDRPSIKKDEEIGKLEVFKNQELIKTIPIYAIDDLESVYTLKHALFLLNKNKKIILISILIIILVLFALLFLIRHIMLNKRRRHRRRGENTFR